MAVIIGILAIGRPTGYWLLDALRAIGYGTLRYWVWDAALLGIGDGLLAIGRPAGYGVWDATLLAIGRPTGYGILDALRAMG